MMKQTLYFGNPAYLSTENFQLIFKNPNTEEKISVAIEDVGVIVLDHYQIQITQGLIENVEKVCVFAFQNIFILFE